MNPLTAENRVELLEKIADIFKKYGLRSTSMDEVATYLHISKKTLYQMFDNKTDLVEQIAMWNQERMFKIFEIKRDVLNGEDLLTQFYIGIQHIAFYHQNNKTTNHYDLRKYYPEIYDKYARQLELHGIQFFNNFLQRCINKGLFREMPNLHIRGYLLLRVLSTFENPEYQSENPLNITNFEMITTLFDIFVRSFATQKGWEQWQQILANPPYIEFPKETLI